MEKWCGIEGFLDYSISNYGRVFSLKRSTYLSPFNVRCGYKSVRICGDRGYKTFRVHRLVAEAFIESYDAESSFVTFIDGNKENCYVGNLKLVTRIKMSDDDIAQARELHESGEHTMGKIAEMLNVSETTIFNVIRKKRVYKNR